MARTYASRLDEYMDRRRLELGMKWRDVAREANISYEALRAARNVEGRPAALTQSGLERALRWKPGSIAALLDDDIPPALAEAPDHGTQSLADAVLDHIERDPKSRARLRRILARAGQDPDPPQPEGRKTTQEDGETGGLSAG